MKYLVKIDRSTIKKNPRAGSTQSMMKKDNASVTVDCTSSSPLPKDLEETAISVDTRIGPDGCHFKFRLLFSEVKAGELYETLKARGFENIMMHLDSGLRPVNHFPEPRYFFKYEPTEVECEYCHAKFPHTELESGESDEDYTEEVCPRCHEWRCCDVEYERIDQVERLVFG